MKKKYKILLFLGTIMLYNIACLWDKDTLRMEKRQFPSTLELITGKFLRHTPEFYYWRIQQRTKQLTGTLADSLLYDDLAVAYSKLGNDEKAIEIMMKQDSIAPNRYETYANLGTFYIHDGKLRDGLIYISKAIEINPNAHFGRELVSGTIS